MKKIFSYQKFTKYLYMVIFVTIIIVPAFVGIYYTLLLTPQDKLTFMTNAMQKVDQNILPLIENTYVTFFSGQYQPMLSKICAKESEKVCLQFKAFLPKNTHYLRLHKVLSSKTTNLFYTLDLNNPAGFDLITVEREYELTDEKYGHQYYKLDTTFTKSIDFGWVLSGINTKIYDTSIIERNSLLKNMNVQDFFILIALVAVYFFVTMSLYLCFFKTNSRLKWLWAIFIIFGSWVVNYNFVTHQFSQSDLDYLLLASGYTTLGIYGPINGLLSIPVGAIIFMLYFFYTRKRGVAQN